MKPSLSILYQNNAGFFYLTQARLLCLPMIYKFFADLFLLIKNK